MPGGSHDAEQSERGVAILLAVYTDKVRANLSRCLADAFLAGGWVESELVARGGLVLERQPHWMGSVVREVLGAYHRPPADRPRELAAVIDAALARGRSSVAPPRVRRWLVAEPAMGRMRWPVPELTSPGALAEFLGVSGGELSWLADVRGLERTAADERLRNYRYAHLPRAGGPARVIERPKDRLKAIQRRLLHEVLDWIAPHEAAHGFIRGRSVLSHAASHSGQYVVVRLDLEDFFAAVPAARVYGVFRAAGYPEAVAHTLTGLVTNAVAIEAWRRVPVPVGAGLIAAHHRLGRRLAGPHLPQGAPTSPALANLAAFRLDRRLSGLAAAVGLRYTRYADDLTFSGGRRLVRVAQQLRGRVAQIAREEGFLVNDRKSTLVTRAGSQRVGGTVVNVHPNLARDEYDLLKAILHNAARDGPGAQNRGAVRDFRAHLLGRIAWVESLNPARGQKLRRRFERIRWEG